MQPHQVRARDCHLGDIKSAPMMTACSAWWRQRASSGECVVQGTPEGVEDNGSLTRVAAFPIGIDPERFARALEKPNVKAHIAQLLNRYAGRKVHQHLHPPA